MSEKVSESQRPPEMKLADCTWQEAEDAISTGAVVVVPVGATEQHGLHLPLETDWRLCSTIAERASAEAGESGVPVLVTPPLWTGYSPHHMGFAGTITLGGVTFMRVVVEIATSLSRHGVTKILFLNGHGGNASILRLAIQELRFEHNIHAVTANYWDFILPFLASWRRSDTGGIGHACEMETALMLTVRSASVRPGGAWSSTWSPPRSSFLSADLLVGAPVAAAWSSSELTETGVMGDPSTSSEERGKELLEAVVHAVSSFIKEFYDWNWDKRPGDLTNGPVTSP